MPPAALPPGDPVTEGLVSELSSLTARLRSDGADAGRAEALATVNGEGLVCMQADMAW